MPGLRLIPARAGKTTKSFTASRTSWAHPRACGENILLLHVVVCRNGSSPRVRGKPHARRVGPRLHGLIPARAGKTAPGRARRTGRRAHPRACGENEARGAPKGEGDGSSPRVRGKPRNTHSLYTQHGLIPARAGKTCPQSSRGSSRTAHPRACGENEDALRDALARQGSSPRVRGKQGLVLVQLRNGRLIPARAGKTPARGLGAGSSPAHPRACGENVTCITSVAIPTGSSPRVRGKLWSAGDLESEPRLIPARAGKTGGSRPAHRRCTAHPRACGENLGEIRFRRRIRRLIPARAGKTLSTRQHKTASKGSSPRVRGKHVDEDNFNRKAGLIPARAGKTPNRKATVVAGQAHPRACGENLLRLSCAFVP